MNAVNAVQLFILVWTFSAVCQADDDIIVSCDNVTGSVGEKVMFNCRVSLQINKCCIKNNMFKYNDLKICRKVLPDDSCEHRKIFTCSYTPNKTMTEIFSFFVQASCGWKKTKFTLNVTGYLRHMIPGNPSVVSPTAVGLGSNDTVITVVVSGFIIILIIIIIIIMKVIYKTKLNSTKLSGFQNRIFLLVRHEDINYPEDVI